MKKASCYLASACVFLLTSSVVHAEDYSRAEFIPGSDKTFSAYPGGEMRMARTARAWISYIVNTDGTVSEPMIEQINNGRFSKTVVKWMKYLRFEPATVNGEPVASLIRDRRAFNIGYDQRSGRVSTTLFNKLDQEFGDEIAQQQPDRKKLEKLLKKLAGVRHGSSLAYEYLSRRRYQFAKQFLDRDAQIYAIRERILSNDRGAVWDSGKIIDYELIDLLLEAGYLGEALEAYYNARNNLNPTMRSELWQRYKTQITQIREISENDQEFARPILIGDMGYAFLPLLKQGAKFDSVAGKLDAIKFRCNKHFAEFKYQAGLEYKAPESWGACQLQIVGDKGATAQLIQF